MYAPKARVPVLATATGNFSETHFFFVKSNSCQHIRREVHSLTNSSLLHTTRAKFEMLVQGRTGSVEECQFHQTTLEGLTRKLVAETASNRTVNTVVVQ